MSEFKKRKYCELTFSYSKLIKMQHCSLHTYSNINYLYYNIISFKAPFLYLTLKLSLKRLMTKCKIFSEVDNDNFLSRKVDFKGKQVVHLCYVYQVIFFFFFS